MNSLVRAKGILLLAIICLQNVCFSANPQKITRCEIGRMNSSRPQEVKDNQGLFVIMAGNATTHGLIKFDFSDLLNRPIKDAAIFLYHDDNNISTKKNVILTAHRLTSDWQAGKVSWWKKNETEKWNIRGGAYDPEPIAKFKIPGGYGSGWIVLQSKKLTDWVNKWKDKKAVNDGLLLRADTGSGRALMRWFGGPEHPKKQCQPFLVVSYDEPIKLYKYGYLSQDDISRTPLRKRMETVVESAGKISGNLKKQAANIENKISSMKADSKESEKINVSVDQFRVDILKKRFPDKSILIWPISPWTNFEKDFIPVDANDVPLQKMLQDEYKEITLGLTNVTGQRKQYKVKMELSKPLAADKITMRISYWTEFRNEKQGREFTKGVWVDDALPPLENDCIVKLNPGESRRLWLTVNSKSVPAGKYPLKVTIMSDNGQAKASKAIMLEVLPKKLSIDPDLHVFTYAYLTRRSTDNCRELAVKDLREHYQNTFVFSGRPRIPEIDKNGNIIKFKDYSNLYLDLIPDAKKVLFFWHWDTISGYGATFGKKVKFGSAAWKKAMHTWIKDFVAYLEKKGFGYDRVVMYPCDETYDNEIFGLSEYKALEKIASEIKAVDPRIKVFMDPVTFRPKSPRKMNGLCGCFRIALKTSSRQKLP